MSEREREYLVFHFYIPDYEMQGTPIPVPMEYFKEYGIKEAILKARDEFLSHLRGSTQAIHPKHLRLWTDGKIQYKLRYRRLTPSAVRTFMNNIRIRHKREE